MSADRNRPGRRRPIVRARLVAEPLEPRQLLAVITVTSAGDADGADGGPSLSLRQAIEVSNGTLAIAALSKAQAGLVSGALGSPNTIDFAIAGTGPFTIRPATSLPAITSPVVIDGYSQPGARPTTDGPDMGNDAVIEVALDGSDAAGASGLDVRAGNSTVDGLAIGGFAGGDGITLEGPAGDSILGDFIGTDATGTHADPNAVGILDEGRYVVAGGSIVPYTGFNTIGGPLLGNVISGNSQAGLMLAGGDPQVAAFPFPVTDLVQGNLIGTDATGSRALPNGEGIAENGGGSSTIGGTAAGAGNVISGNIGDGLGIHGYGTSTPVAGYPFPSSDLVQGNRIGTDVSGQRALPNGGDGISESGGPTTIGGTAAGAGNVLSGNAGDGLKVTDGFVSVLIGGGASVLVQGNHIGTDLAGTGPVPNGGDGIQATNSTGDSTIGGSDAGAANVIAFNRGSGVAIGLTTPTNFLPRWVTSGNAIFANGDLGISYSPEAAMTLVPAPPAIRSVTPSGAGSMIAGTITGFPSSTYTVEFFADDAPDPSGSGQGRTYLGSTEVTTGPFVGTPVVGDYDNYVTAPFAFTSASPLLGRYVTATATLGQTSNSLGNLGAGASTTEFARDLLGDTVSGTTTTLEGSSPVAGSGQPITFTASVASTAGSIPTGQVIFFEDGVVLGSSPIDAAGLAILAAPIAPGSHTITADYPGDASHAASTSGAFVVTGLAPPAPLAITLLGPNRVATQGQPITFTASLTSAGPVPTGLVEFLEDGVGLGSTAVGAFGIATFVTDQLLPGPHVITAAYLGDGNHSSAPSGSNAVAVEVNNVTAFGGPAVTSDVLSGPDSVTVTFNRGLLIGPAQAVANYRIMGPRHQLIAIESAVYDPSDASVTLTTARPLDPEATYVLTINGQDEDRIVDVFGIALNGKAKGKPGHDYSGKVEVKKAPAAKVEHPSAAKPKPKEKAHATAHKKAR